MCVAVVVVIVIIVVMFYLPIFILVLYRRQGRALVVIPAPHCDDFLKKLRQ